MRRNNCQIVMNSPSRVPAISVVLPVFNGGTYLREAVESVIAQDFDDYELLICDDGSTDGTREYLQSLRYPRVRVLFNEKNRGQFASFNRLIGEASGELVHMFSHDDYMLRDCLRRTVEFHLKHPGLAFSYCGVRYMDIAGLVSPDYVEDQTPTLIRPSHHAEIALTWGCIAGSISTVTVPSRIFKEFGGFDETLPNSGDYEFQVRVSAERSIGFIRQPLVYVRKHPGQVGSGRLAPYYHAIAAFPILSKLEQRVCPEFRLKARRCRLWKIHVHHFNAMVAMLRRGRRDLALVILQELRRHDWLPMLSLRWMMVRLLRFCRIDKHFYRYCLRL